MFDTTFFHSGLFNWVLLPLMIFFSRMCDVTLGTLRHIFISKGYKKIVPFLGFIEVLIWLIVIGQIMKNLNNFACYIAWAGGFAAGTFFGMKIDEKLALGVQLLRIISNQPTEELLSRLQKENLGTTIIEGKGSKGPVKVILTAVKRKDLSRVEKIIDETIPNSFYSLEDIRQANQGVFPMRGSGGYFGQLFSNQK